MHFTAPPLSAAEAARLILQGAPLGGGGIDDGAALIRQLIGAAPGAVVIDNAVFRRLSFPAVFPLAVVFRNCTFVESVAPDHATDFQKELRFERCRFSGGFAAAHCRFHKGLWFRRVVIENALRLANCAFDDYLRCFSCTFEGEFTVFAGAEMTAPSQHEDCQFLGSVDFNIQDGVRVNPTWRFGGCRFAGRMRIALDRPSRLSFPQCQFDAASDCQIEYQEATRAECEFTGAQLAGRVSLRQTTAFPPAARSDWASVALDGTVVGGLVDLRDFPVGSLNMKDASIRGGEIHITWRNLTQRFSWRTPWQVREGDRVGCLTMEQKLPTSPSADNLHEVARQYQELRNTFARMSNSDWKQDFCHYKCMDYRRRARAANAGLGRLQGCIVAPLVVLCWVAMVWLWFVGGAGRLPERLASWYGKFALAALTLSLLIVLMGTGLRFSQAVRQFVDWFFYKRALGYGVYLFRVLTSAVIVWAGFALFYYLVATYAPEAGTVAAAGQGNVAVVGNQKAQTEVRFSAPESAPPDLETCLYFSGVTFTTLGYGDAVPTRMLRLVAAGESMVGALTIALVIVILARKFIR